MAKPFHFIRFKQQRLLYGRVPKAANSSIKAAMCRLLSEGLPKKTKTSADSFWQNQTDNQTELITPARARLLSINHFSFGFVRNPFDRLIAAYNNKVIEIKEPPLPMQNMGITHGMPFETFLDILIDTPFKQFDVHVLPQSQILCMGNQIVPKFVGRVEQIDDHWAKLRTILANRGIEVMESLPQKNVRRTDHCGLESYFSSDSLIEKTMKIYGNDVRLFYNDVSVDHLIQNSSLPAINPRYSTSLKLSNWLRTHGLRN